MGQVIQLFPTKAVVQSAATKLLIRRITLEHQIEMLEVQHQAYMELVKEFGNTPDGFVARSFAQEITQQLYPLQAEYLQYFGL